MSIPAEGGINLQDLQDLAKRNEQENKKMVRISGKICIFAEENNNKTNQCNIKKISKLSLLIILFVVQSLVANAQIPYNSAFAYLTNTTVPTPSAAFVREYSANLSIICTYINPYSYPHLIMVDATTGYTSPAITLDQMQYVSDLSIHITITPNTFSYDIVPWNITPTSPSISSRAITHSIGCVQY